MHTVEALCSSALSHKAALYLAAGHVHLLTCRQGIGMLKFMHAWTFNSSAYSMCRENKTDQVYATLDLMTAPLGHYYFYVDI